MKNRECSLLVITITAFLLSKIKERENIWYISNVSEIIITNINSFIKVKTGKNKEESYDSSFIVKATFSLSLNISLTYTVTISPTDNTSLGCLI